MGDLKKRLQEKEQEFLAGDKPEFLGEEILVLPAVSPRRLEMYSRYMNMTVAEKIEDLKRQLNNNGGIL